MNRALKQFTFGSAYFAFFAIAALGIYFFYFQSAPSCTDNKQNQKEAAIDCGGPCIPCELKALNLITEEVRAFPAGKGQTTLLAKVRNPSQDFTVSFSYDFGSLSGERELEGRKTLLPGGTQYIVVPGLPVDVDNIKINLKISDLNWSRDSSPALNIRITSDSRIDKTRVTITGVLSNNSATNLPVVKLTALLFDKEGKILNASITQLEKVGAFSEKQFTVFFPEVEGLAKDFDSQRTEIYWDLNE